ncbi:MAG TPA: condensation domain-containing protein, partial [Polyangiaceae bacterium]|nr:condensation domain-containing protein [Polyangiaceae bacterium]
MSTHDGGPFRTSSAQQQLIRLHQLSGAGSCAYNESIAWRMARGVEHDVLRIAVDHLERRHSAFRTRFSADGSLQFVAATPAQQWEIRGVSGSLGQALEALGEARRFPFNLETGPLHRWFWFDLEQDGYLLGLIMHHSVVDGQSFAIVQRELPVCYAAARAGEFPQLKPASSYVDHVETQLKRLAAGELSVAEAYWNEVIDLRLPHPLPPQERVLAAGPRSYRGREVHAELTREDWASLQQTCRSEDISAAVGLLGSFSLALSTWSACNAFIVGVGVSSRPLPATDTMVGYAVNPLPIGLSVEWSESMAALWKRTRTALLRAVAHRNIPIAAVMERRGEAGAAHRVVFDYFDGFDQSPNGALALEMHPVPSPFAAFDLRLALTPLRGGLRVTCQYDADRYAEATIAGFCDTFLYFVRRALHGTSHPL